MREIEPISLLLKYSGEFYEIVYSDDHLDFIYTPSVPPVFILFPHQLFSQVIQEQPSEDLFEAKSNTKVPSLEHLQIWFPQYEIFMYFFPLDFIRSYSSDSLLYYRFVSCPHKVSWAHYLILCIYRYEHYMWNLSSQSIVINFSVSSRIMLYVCNLFTINISHYFKLITCSLDRSLCWWNVLTFTLLLSSKHVHTRFTSLLCAY